VEITIRTLGRSGLRVPALGLGCMGMSEFYGPSDASESLATLHHALDVGVTFWDTADMYGNGANERLLGRVLADRRPEVVLATKFGIVREGTPTVCGRPEYVRRACDASLARLGIERIDLYYLHRVDPDVPIEETAGAMGDLVRAGKVAHLGLSEAGAETLRRASREHEITALQSEYSLWSRDLEGGILAACRELGIGLVAYSPLGRGFLTGALRDPGTLAADDYRRGTPRFQGENLAHNLELLDRLEALAAARGCTPAQLALAWVLAQGDDVVPIPGTRRRERLDQNVEALGLALSPAELAEIDARLPRDAAAGTRYPAAAMARLEG